MKYVRFTLVLACDTEDEEEAKEEVLDFITMSNEGTYSPVRLVGKMTVVPETYEEF